MNISPSFRVGPLSDFEPGTLVRPEHGGFGLVVVDHGARTLAFSENNRFNQRQADDDENFVGITSSVEIVLDWSRAPDRDAPALGSGNTLFLYGTSAYVVVRAQGGTQWRLLNVCTGQFNAPQTGATFVFRNWQYCLAAPCASRLVLKTFSSEE